MAFDVHLVYFDKQGSTSLYNNRYYLLIQQINALRLSTRAYLYIHYVYCFYLTVVPQSKSYALMEIDIFHVELFYQFLEAPLRKAFGDNDLTWKTRA